MLVVRFEDESLLVVEKPAGMHTAPLRPAETGTLLGLVIDSYPEVRDVPGIKPVEPGLLHRLDRETSGLVVVARTARALEALRGSFDEMRKEYLAVCAARDEAVTEESFTIASRFAPYGPGRRSVRVVAADETGHAAREATRDVYTTSVTILSRQGQRVLVRAALTRGFRHQVRAHLAHAGYPILGDPLYGQPVPAGFPPRMYLHAASIRLRHPVTGAALQVDSPAPPEFAALISMARRRRDRIERSHRMSQQFQDRDIISITDFSREEILSLCAAGSRMAELEKTGGRNSLRDALKHRTLSYMFYEPSTRTRTSFNTGMRELGGRYDGFSGTEGTSVMKAETVRDTVTMMCANHNDVIVMRHPLDGSLQWAADVANIPVINGGDGKNEHPTQALLDVLTIYALRQGRLDGLRIGFGGDLSHGRTVRSLSLALSHFDNITIHWAAEDFLGMPEDLMELLAARNVKVRRESSVRDVMRQVDFYYMTRPQLERMPGVKQKDIVSMMKQYRIDVEKIEGFDVRVLHPLPVNSEIAEIDYRVYFTKAQAFFAQAEYGIFLRKALLYEMLSHPGYKRYDGSLPPELGTGNNRLPRAIMGVKQSGMFIDKIQDGTVIDHLQPGTLRTVSDALDLENRGYSCTTATIAEKPNPFIKTNLRDIPERDLKRISLLSPEPTIDKVQNGRVVEKFVYLLCANTNCITRTVNEDVPPRFYNDHGTIRCRYCRRPYTVAHRKVTDPERSAYLGSLPDHIEPVKYPD